MSNLSRKAQLHGNEKPAIKQRPFPVPDFRLLFESAPGAYLVLTPKLIIVAASDNYLRATMTRREDLLGKDIFDIFPGSSEGTDLTGPSNLYTSLLNVINNKVSDTMAVQYYPIRLPSSEGGGFIPRYWSPVNSPVFDSRKRLAYIIHRVEDVTEYIHNQQTEREAAKLLKSHSSMMESEVYLRAQQLQDTNKRLRLAQQELQEGKKELEHRVEERTHALSESEDRLKDLYKHAQDAIRSRDELLTICSHELRTPISSLKLQTQMIKRNLSKGDLRAIAPERLQKLIEQSDRQLDRLTRLIEEMLDFSRIAAGKFTLNLESFDFAELVYEVLERMESRFQAEGYTLITQIEEPVIGIWDRERLDQVLSNVIENSIKYGSGKPITVSLKQENDHIVLSVKDHGLGISNKDLNRVFEPYERAVSVSNISGLGLGLFISRTIIEAHQGTITAESELGKGSTFHIELPLVSVNPSGVKEDHYAK